MNSGKNIKLKFSNSFPALTHKYFRYFWFGQCVSLIGTWMQSTTQGWLVLEITNRNTSFLLGLINALQFTPMMIFSLFAGVIVDRFSKRKLLIFTQIGLMLMAVIQGFLVLTGLVRFWHLAIIALITGCINTIDMPTRQSFVIELVGKEDLMNGIALNSSVFNAARILGPSIAGIIIAYTGIEVCYIINAVSFIPVIYGIFKIKSKPVKINENKNMLREIKDGLIYIKGNRNLVKTFSLITIMGIFAFNYNVLIPLFAVDILGLSSKGYGFLMSSLGIGSLIGALTMATKSKNGPKFKLILFAAYIVSLLLIILGINRGQYVMALLLSLVGIFNITFSTSANSTVQLNSKDEYRGRVMSVYSLLFAGVAPIGSLFTGTISNNFGPAKAFIFSGIVAMIFITAVYLIDKIVKNNYINIDN
ncbi:MFS transporter [Clostridium senegalense]|uniref:MFS transporter n=1 Tax=Clostridium senegalense TaxID=1465809 RepID=UPI001C0FD8DF|nr:MFS transporter [Clostridium senegalense]MBU5227915.1 MFS transporter [Clostridium senegalense]